MAKPSEVAHTIRCCLEEKQSLFIWGPPGVGKSAVTHQVCEVLNREMIDIRLSLLDSVDLRGFPFITDGRMQFASPAFLPTDPSSTAVLFLDELNLASDAVVAAAYQLIHDRRIGDYHLPPKVGVIAAGNRETDGAAVHTMAAPLANRFCHIDYDVDFDDWRKWAMNANVRPEIVNFINFRPALLNDFDPDKRAFPTPRSWSFVSRILGNKNVPPTVERLMIAGCVGDGASAEFASFLKIYRDLPDPDKILLSPKTADVPEDLATLYALCGALAARANDKNFPALIDYCDRLRAEFQVLCVRDAVVRNRELASTKAFADWAVKHSADLV